MPADGRPTSAESPLDGKTPKYLVLRGDGSPLPPGRQYLVLRVDGKPPESAERHALQAYLLALDQDGGRDLADHLRAFFGVADDPLMRLEETA